jgi:hypothetical protein
MMGEWMVSKYTMSISADGRYSETHQKLLQIGEGEMRKRNKVYKVHLPYSSPFHPLYLHPPSTVPTPGQDLFHLSVLFFSVYWFCHGISHMNILYSNQINPLCYLLFLPSPCSPIIQQLTAHFSILSSYMIMLALSLSLSHLFICVCIRSYMCQCIHLSFNSSFHIWGKT